MGYGMLNYKILISW